jgi:hypothetical protein
MSRIHKFRFNLPYVKPVYLAEEGNVINGKEVQYASFQVKLGAGKRQRATLAKNDKLFNYCYFQISNEVHQE